MKVFLILVAAILVNSCAFRSVEVPQNKILFVVSNAHFYGKSDINTSNNFPEIVFAYDEFDKAGYAIDFVSPEGGRVPVGYINSDTLLQKYLYDEAFMNKMEFTKKPAEIVTSEYAAIFYAGGGSAMFGVPKNRHLHQIAQDIFEENGGIVSAVCHGTAGIANIKKSDGSYLVEGKKINGFPDLFEDKTRAYFQEFPFSIEEQIRKNGGVFEFSFEGWDGYFVMDGRVITGQDPTSSAHVATAVIKALSQQPIN